jgi:hypothetical protein
MRRLGGAVARPAVPLTAHAALEALQKARALAQFLEPFGADLGRVEPGALGKERKSFG